MNRSVTIGELARLTGVPAKTIRYYEGVDVLPTPRRSPSGYRLYGQRDVHRLQFVRRARALGLSLQDLKALTAELDHGLCATMRPQLLEMVQAHLQVVQQRIAEFQLLQQQLEQVSHQLLAAPLSDSDPADPNAGCQCLEVEATATAADSTQLCTLAI